MIMSWHILQCFNKGKVTERKASAKDVADTRKYKKIQMESLYSLQTSDFSQVGLYTSFQDSHAWKAIVKKEETYMDDDDLNAVVAAIEADTFRNHVHSVLNTIYFQHKSHIIACFSMNISFFPSNLSETSQCK